MAPDTKLTTRLTTKLTIQLTLQLTISLLLLAAGATAEGERVKLTITPAVVNIGQDLQQIIRCDVINITTNRIVAIQIYDIPKEKIIAFVGLLKRQGGDILKDPAIVDSELQIRMTASGSVANVSNAFLEIQHVRIWSCCNVHHFGCMVFYGNGSSFATSNATTIYKAQTANTSRILAFKHCPPPPEIEHGQRLDEFRGNFPAGARVAYACLEGFVPKAHDKAVCRDGSWHDLPQCISKPKVVAAPLFRKGSSGSSPSARASPFICTVIAGLLSLVLALIV